MLDQIKTDNTTGILLTTSLARFNQLNTKQKFFLTKINSLDNEKHCYASDEFFSEFFGLSEKQCNRIIQQLADKELINIKTFNFTELKGRIRSKRIITVLPSTKKKYFPPRTDDSNTCDGIWVPIEIWKDKAFDLLEKLFYCLIKGFDKARGCLYSNNEFAAILGISRVRAVQILTALNVRGVIEILKRDNGRNNRQAKSIHLINKCTESTSKFLESTSKFLESTSKNLGFNGLKFGGHRNIPSNNTQISNTQVNNKADKSADKRLTPLSESTQQWVKIHSKQMKKSSKQLSKQPIDSLINQYIVENEKDRRRFSSLFGVVANNDVIYQSLLDSLIDSIHDRHNDQQKLTANDAIDYCFQSLKLIYRDVPISQYMR